MNIKKIIAAVLCLSVLVSKTASGHDIIWQNQTEVTLMASASEAKEVIKILPATVNSEYKQVLVDGSTTNMDEGTVYRGLGVITGNNSSRLLMDYKAKNPKAYWEIMNLLFKPDYGAGLTHVKIEFGTDVNSSSGTEPSIMRSEDEEADVTRGAGFMFAADALSINPDISVDLLRWGEPKWVTDAFSVSQENGFKARYKWYKAALDKAYDTYGIKFTHISADSNEAAKVDTEWIIYFADMLENETDERYDYGAIKIVASDEIGGHFLQHHRRKLEFQKFRRRHQKYREVRREAPVKIPAVERQVCEHEKRGGCRHYERQRTAVHFQLSDRVLVAQRAYRVARDYGEHKKHVIPPLSHSIGSHSGAAFRYPPRRAAGRVR